MVNSFGSKQIEISLKILFSLVFNRLWLLHLCLETFKYQITTIKIILQNFLFNFTIKMLIATFQSMI